MMTRLIGRVACSSALAVGSMLSVARPGTAQAPSQQSTEATGTFAPAGPPVAPPSRVDAGGNCVVDLRQAYDVVGTLTGSFEIDYRILVHGPCELPPVPGKYDEEWIARGTFTGVVGGSPASGSLTYTARVQAGGVVHGRIWLGGDLEGELVVSGNFGDGRLSYQGTLK